MALLCDVGLGSHIFCMEYFLGPEKEAIGGLTRPPRFLTIRGSASMIR